MNLLGIDYGTKRIGLSFSDSEVGFAFPLAAIQVTDRTKAIEEVVAVVREKRIHQIVVGYPINMDDSIGFKAKEVDQFIEDLSTRISCPIERMDERLTSEAVQDMQGHRSPGNRQNMRKKGTIDSVAATIILQDYLDIHTNIVDEGL